jgi:ribosome silencing factor RsfS/YbeB/iojap
VKKKPAAKVKTVAKKPAAKKPAKKGVKIPAKAAAKKTVKKVAKKAVKAAVKKVIKKVAKKVAAKKPAKAPARKTAAKKPVKAVAKKAVAKKAVAKKSAVKKPVSKKAVTKKVAAKKPAAKKAIAKKPAIKKLAAKKPAAKKTVAKKPATKKAAATKVRKTSPISVAAPTGPRYTGPDWPLMNVILDAMDDAKAEQIIAINLEGRSSMADGMVIASGRVNRHVAAIADQLVTKLKSFGQKDVRVEGLDQSDWVLVDAGNVIVHIFRPEVRSFYNLEKLWSEHAPSEQGTMDQRDA